MMENSTIVENQDNLINQTTVICESFFSGDYLDMMNHIIDPQNREYLSSSYYSDYLPYPSTNSDTTIKIHEVTPYVNRLFCKYYENDLLHVTVLTKNQFKSEVSYIGNTEEILIDSQDSPNAKVGKGPRTVNTCKIVGTMKYDL